MITAQLSVGALLLVRAPCRLMASYTGWDTAAQRLWFDSATHEWVVSNELHARLTWFFYDGPQNPAGGSRDSLCRRGAWRRAVGVCRRNAAGGACCCSSVWPLSRCCSAVQNSSPMFLPRRSRSSGANTSIRACWNAGTPPMKAVPRQVFPGGARFGRFCAHDAVLLLPVAP